MDLEFCEEGPSQVPLVFELVHEFLVLLESLQVLNDFDLFATIDSLVVVEEFVDNLLEMLLLCQLLGVRDELFLFRLFQIGLTIVLF